MVSISDSDGVNGYHYQILNGFTVSVDYETISKSHSIIHHLMTTETLERERTWCSVKSTISAV